MSEGATKKSRSSSRLGTIKVSVIVSSSTKALQLLLSIDLMVVVESEAEEVVAAAVMGGAVGSMETMGLEGGLCWVGFRMAAQGSMVSDRE